MTLRLVRAGGLDVTAQGFALRSAGLVRTASLRDRPEAAADFRAGSAKPPRPRPWLAPRADVMVTLVAVIMLAHGVAVAGGAGSTGGNGLKLPAGARPTAMGGAFVGLADDLNSLTWNPAGLANVTAMEFSMMHSSYLADSYYDVLAGALPLPWLGTAAASLNMLNFGTLPHTVEQVGGLFGGITGNGSAEDVFFTVGWGTKLPPLLGLDRIKAGVNAKLTFEQLSGGSMAGVGISGGALWDAPVDGLRVGTMIDNLGGVGGAGLMPLSWVAGASYARDINRDFTGLAVLDTRVAIDVGLTLNLGLEVAAFDLLTARAGWRGGGALGGPTLGLGVKYPVELFTRTMLFKIDYAMATSGELGSSQRFQLSAQFGRGDVAARKKEWNLRVTKTGVAPEIAWDSAAAAFKVMVRQKTDAGFLALTERPITVTTYALAGMPPGQYVVKVLTADAANPNWDGPGSPDLEVTVAAPAPELAPAPVTVPDETKPFAPVPLPGTH